MIKPGYRTSEFWFTVVSFIFSGLYLVGLIGENSQKEDLIRDVSHGVESAILIGGQLAILWKYINSRKQIKETWWSTATVEERMIEEKKNKPKPKAKPKAKTIKKGTSKNEPKRVDPKRS